MFNLTGLDMQENQARRVLNDLDYYRSRAVMPETDVDEETVARHWVTDVFEPVLEAVPDDLAAKLEPAEIFHEVLEHRWFLSEAAGHEVSLEDAVKSYVDNVLRFRPDEQALLDPDLMGNGLMNSDLASEDGSDDGPDAAADDAWEAAAMRYSG